MLFTIGILLVAGPGSWGAEPPKRVLILDSFGRIGPLGTLISAFRTELSSRSAEPVDVYEVSLDMARFSRPGQEAPFVDFLKARFADRQADLVLVVGIPALSFVNRHAAFLFPGSPLLIVGVADQALHAGAIPKGAVHVPLRVDPKGMIEDILQVLPKTETIAVIFGVSDLERFWAETCRREFPAFSGRVGFVFLDGLPFEQIQSRVRALPPNAAVFFGQMIEDGGGTFFDPRDAFQAIVKIADVPVFAPFESFLGLGAVGGRPIPERAVGLMAAEAALRMLRGETADPDPNVVPAVVAPVYDWRELQRWGIPEALLPPGSVVRFRQPTPWERYRWRILGAAGLLVLQTILIWGLLVQRIRKKRAERQLIQSEQRLRMITNALPVLIGYADADQRYQFNNDAYREWFGFTPEEARGRTILDVVGRRTYQGVAAYVQRALSGEQVAFSGDLELRDGSSVSVEAIYVPDVGSRGQVRGFYTLVVDVTERNLAREESRRLQDELLHAGRISTMGELAGALAHEITQPLSAIMSNAQAAQRFLNAPDPDLVEVKEILQDIVKADARAGEVIARLRTLLRKAKTEIEALDINQILQDVVRLLHSDAVIRDVQISLDLLPELPCVRGDRVQLQQVILNLAMNAFDAACDRQRGERRVWIGTDLKEDRVLTWVSDNGTGIPDGEAEALFRAFHTTKHHGLGLGLSISRSIVNRHQGRIWAENRPGGGATFFFCLPLGDHACGPERK